MSDRFAPLGETQPEVEGRFAEGRRTDRTYVSRSFTDPGSPGQPARFITKVFDPEEEIEVETVEGATQWLIRTSSKGRAQVKLLVAQEAGHVSKVMIQRVTSVGGVARAETKLALEGQEAERLVELLRNVERIPIVGEDGFRVDDTILREVLASPDSVSQLYERNPDLFRRLITSDATARDVVALERRRTEVDRFRRLLDDAEYFDAAVAETASKREEDVWQRFFEANPWILGTGLGGQLYTSWDSDKLEQIVGGPSIANEGKRADALMRTTGVVRWMTFAEFKTHRKPLLAAEYRPGTYPPSADLIGGVAQAQATVRRAVKEIDEAIRDKAADGSELPGEITFLTKPRSFLVIGRLDQLLGEGGGPHVAKIRSFELFRRSLYEPEIVTFDELLARAEWVIDTEDAAR